VAHYRPGATEPWRVLRFFVRAAARGRDARAATRLLAVLTAPRVLPSFMVYSASLFGDGQLPKCKEDL
jgi:hypothetical protein